MPSRLIPLQSFQLSFINRWKARNAYIGLATKSLLAVVGDRGQGTGDREQGTVLASFFFIIFSSKTDRCKNFKPFILIN